MEVAYLAQQNEIRRFGYLARRIHRIPPPAPLSCPFSNVVVPGMAYRGLGRPVKRRKEDWCQEAWMEEDDLLQEDFRHEQDLQKHLQHGLWIQEDGTKGRKMESTSGRALVLGAPNQDRSYGGKGASENWYGQQQGSWG